jgi:hypothetical protein
MSDVVPLKFAHEDDGFCRVCFTRCVDGHVYRYCWQREGDWKFCRCSGDFEPSHEVMGFQGVPAKQLTPKNPGETQTGRDLNAFIEGA